MWQQVNCVHQSRETLVSLRVFAATLLLVILTILSEADKLIKTVRLISRMTSILEDLCDVTYRRKTY